MLRYSNKLTRNLSGFYSAKVCVSFMLCAPCQSARSTILCHSHPDFGTQAEGAPAIWRTVWAQQKEKKKSSRTPPYNSSTQRWVITLPLTLDWPRQNPSGHGSALLCPSGERVYKWAKWLPRPCVLEASPQQNRDTIFRPVKACRAHSSTLCGCAKFIQQMS